MSAGSGIVDAIRPHEYRLATADRFISASFGKAA
jgi:hypothetical protein